MQGHFKALFVLLSGGMVTEVTERLSPSVYDAVVLKTLELSEKNSFLHDSSTTLM